MQSPREEETAFVRDTVHQKQSERDRFRNAKGSRILKNWKFFKRSKNAGNCPKSAQNQKKIEKFHLQFFSNCSKNVGSVRFSDNFQHFGFFENFEKSEYFF
jgi:hypothetical protein